MKLFYVIKKNFKFLMYHKFSTMIVLFGPLLLIIIASLAFNSTQLHGIKIGVVYDTNQDDSILEYFLNNVEEEGYSILHIKNIEYCSDQLKLNRLHVCIEEKRNLVSFYVEPSRMNLVHIILNVLSSSIDSATEDLKLTLLNDLIQQISLINYYVIDSSNEFDSFLSKTDILNEVLNDLSDEIISIEVNFDKDNNNINEIKIANQNSKENIILFEKDIKNQINSNIQKLNSFNQILDEIEKDLIHKKNIRDNIYSELDSNFIENECNQSLDYNLFSYYSNIDLIKNKITSSNEPECYYIETIKHSVNQCVGDLDSTLKELNNVKKMIDSSKKDLVSLDAESDLLFNEAIEHINLIEETIIQSEHEMNNLDNEINMIETSKLELSNQLQEINKELNKNKIVLEEFNVGFKNMSNQLETITEKSGERLLTPVINRVEGFDKSRSNIDYFFPILIAFIIIFVGVLLSNILIMKEKKSRAFFRNIISPTNSLIIPFGVYFTGLIIVLFQVFIIFLLALLLLPIAIYINPLELLITISIGISIFLSLGIIIGNFIESEETSIIISILICIVLMIFSSILLPLEAMPPFFHSIIKLNPFYIVTDVISKQIINGLMIKTLLNEFISLCITFVLFFSISMFTFKKEE